jgi:hypothetical protein
MRFFRAATIHWTAPGHPVGRWRAALLLSLFILSGSALSFAAAPPNDNCASATVIPGAGPFPYLSPRADITGATTAGDPPITEDFYKTRVVRSVWYVFTPAVNAIYTLATCAGAGATETTADTVMAIYTSSGGCNGPFVQDGSLDDNVCEPQAALTRPLLADTMYYVVIWKYCDNCPEDGLNDVQLMITATIPPPNDTCATAIALQQNIPVTGTTVGARDSYRLAGTNAFTGIDQIPSSAPGLDVVYSFTAGHAAEYSFKVSGYETSQDPVLYVGLACPAGSSNEIAAVRAANRAIVSSAEEVMCLPMTAGQKVFLFVDDTQTNNAGSGFTLEVNECRREREPNDSPADAADLADEVHGSLNAPGDRDFFKLGSYPAGWRAFAMVDGESARNADFDLRVTTFSDTVEYDDDNNDAAFAGASPNLAGTWLTGGASFLVVDYKIPRATEPYRLYAVVQPPLASASVEQEPNDSLAEANSSEQNYFYGWLNGPSPSTDADTYAFGVAEGDLIFLSLDCDPHRTNAPVNARLELFDSAGIPVAAVNDGAFSSAGGTNVSANTLFGTSPSAPGESLVYRSPVEGTFFARVSASPAAGASGAGRYLLSIARNGLVGGDAFNHAPELSNTTISLPVVAGLSAALQGTIWELDLLDAVTLTVNWGDGATNTYQYTAGQTDFSLTHTYTASTNLNITLSVRDRSGAGNGATIPVRVRPFIAPARFLSIEHLPNSRIRLALTGTPFIQYRVETLGTNNTWSSLGTSTADAAGLFSIEDLAPVDSSRLYRAVGE